MAIRRQSQKRILQLIGQFPALGQVKSMFMSASSDAIVRILVQRPDPDMMHHYAKNALDVSRAYVFDKDYPGERGSRLEILYAADDNHHIVATLDWRKLQGESRFTTTAHEIFNRQGFIDPSYLFWVIVTEWYDSEGRHNTRPKEITFIVYSRPKNMSWSDLRQIALEQKIAREEAWKYPPNSMPRLFGIEKALAIGARISAFSSGGGLRVIRLNKNGELIGYGEAPHVEEALQYADEDFTAGGLPYKEVYGSGKKHPHYLTGSSDSTSNLDHWLRRGNSFDCWFDDEQVVFRLDGYGHEEIPEDIKRLAEENPGTAVRYELRGMELSTTYTPGYFANGEGSWSMDTISNPLRKSRGIYPMTKTGTGKDFWQAMLAAFEAPEVESKDQ